MDKYLKCYVVPGSLRHVSHVNNPYNERTLIRRESSVALLGTIIAFELFSYNGYLFSEDSKIYSREIHQRREYARLPGGHKCLKIIF